ncbi:MAG: phosphoribosylformylglycinamidine synthase I [Methanomicrobiales archaeon]|jgi:phosphoribosylformylglycinamidine synthase|nr:phosphoribosylformylglycinamidine synthase I [Methanomicrobiales archaeon]
MRFAVVQFGGSNCDRDVAHVIADICGVDCDLVWYKDRLQRKYDAIVLPGGFSYGDYLRAGAIAARTPVMDEVVRHAQEGGLVLGICNGAQICAERGLVPGTFTMNAYPKFICRWVYIRIENAMTPFTNRFKNGEVIRIPIAHREGRYVPDQAAGGVSDNQVVFRFCSRDGAVIDEYNPNGSFQNITGVLGGHRNVLAMMPHPERASDEVLGSVDGRRIFSSMVQAIGERA